jgi:hypothetical protein
MAAMLSSPEDGGHAQERPEPGSAVGQDERLEAAQRSAHDEQRREHAARRAGAERDHPDARLRHHEHEERAANEVAAQERLDDVVTDAERARLDEAAEPDGGAADRGPPHPVDGQLLERVLEEVDPARE